VSSRNIIFGHALLTRRSVWILLAVVGLAVWFAGLAANAPRAWRGLLIAFLWLTPAAGGMVVWSAVLVVSRARWAGSLEKAAVAGIAFCVPSLAALALLWYSSASWAPWENAPAHQKLWLSRGFVFGRDGAALVAFWAAAAWYVGRGYRNRRMWPAGLTILIYCLTVSLLGFDLVMTLTPKWYSTLAGGHLMVSGMYTAVAAWTVVGAWRADATGDRRHDLGRLIVAFSIMTAYTAYSHLLPIWYGNLPVETRFFTLRFAGGWRWVAYAVLAGAYLGPLAILLTIRAKRSRWFLAAAATLFLIMMWVERWWLVAPSFESRPVLGAAETGPALLLAATFAFGIEIILPRLGTPEGGDAAP
jgi:hypothetical protein